MKKLITNAFLSLFLEKDAREKVIAGQKTRKRAATSKKQKPPASNQAPTRTPTAEASPPTGLRHPMTNERAELIKNAVRVQQAQSRNLSPADKRRLQALAKGKFPQPSAKKR